MKLHSHSTPVAVCRLAPGTDAPEWAVAKPAPVMSITYTAGETSVVCAADAVPSKVTSEGPFCAFEVAGPLDFALTGVLAKLLEPLNDDGISVFTISTYDTDWILVPVGKAAQAEEAFRRYGHRVTSSEVATKIKE